jgi:hypothetical protein
MIMERVAKKIRYKRVILAAVLAVQLLDVLKGALKSFATLHLECPLYEPVIYHNGMQYIRVFTAATGRQ